MLQKLGHTTAFIGKVGDDFFGEQLQKAIEDAGIDSRCLLKDREVHTTLAMVHTLPDGDRDFSFYRNPGADMMLEPSEIPEEVFARTKIFHFGSLSMTHETVRKATQTALERAKAAGCLISFDPNLREPLWDSLDEAGKQILEGLSWCDLLKISDNEIQWLTGREDYSEGVQWIKERFPAIKLILVSMGKHGSRAYFQDKMIEEPAFISTRTIETTGAGDTFMGCVLHFVCQTGMDALDEEWLHHMLRFANAAASLVTERKGALRVMPEEDEIVAKLNT